MSGITTIDKIKRQQAAGGGRAAFGGGGTQGAGGDKGYQGGGRDTKGNVSGTAPGAAANYGGGPDDRATETQDYNTYKATGKNPLDLDIERIERFGGPTLTPKEILKAKNQTLFYDNKPKYPKYIPGYLQTAANFNRKPNRKYFYEKYLKNNAQNLNYTDLEKAYEKYMDNRMAGYTDAMGNVSSDYRLENGRYVQNDQGGGVNQPIEFNYQDQYENENENEEGDNGDDSNSVDYTQDVIYDDYGTAGYRTTRAAEGGIMGTRARRAMGGIMNRVDQRQGYFLGGIGKAIGKIGKAAGKVLKSDIGKAAIAGAMFYYGGGGKFAAGGMKGFSPGNFFSKANPLLFNADKTLSLSKLAGVSTVLPFLAGEAKPNQTSFGDRGAKMKDSKGNDAVGTDIRAEIDDAYESGDPERIAAIEKYYSFLPPTKEYMPYSEFGDEGYRTTVATGGRIGFNDGGTTITLMDGTTVKIPSGSYNSSGSLKDKIYSSSKGDLLREEIIRKLSFANGGRIGKAEGGLLDLGGMEKDYRAEGGFVPIGEYEKKDDVPARLSVNEFVMTADAVRGAGQGDIDKGAEIMENMMKNLENGGTVSEESQGNKGAQQMFETSERLGAII